MNENPKKHDHEEAIFHAALELESPQARADYLTQACGEDLDLLGRMKALLELNEIEDGFLENPPTLLDIPPVDHSPVEPLGSVIGRCRLLEKIGEGGMATVYLAEQEQPVRRRVALKIIKPGMDSKQVIARFEAERQALALMNHPHIARVFDGGTTERGRPYFVMELVRGDSITAFCDKHGLGIEERLRLFVEVCHAVQHAHQQGVIHRDLKPSNILVTLEDEQAVPKIIDFGIAKAIQHRLTEQTLCTAHGQLIGTPAYMSPEQAGLGQYRVDARTDVYSLGVLLYELLTGTTPFTSQTFRDLPYDEICRIIRDIDPPKPSTRLGLLGDALADVARDRHIGSDPLQRTLQGDLDWIVTKALEKDQDRRYETVRDLALDIERHLRDEPVVAGPPSTVYRLGKFVRRHRGGSVTFLLVTAALVMGGAVTRLAFRNTPGSMGKDEHAVGMTQRHIWNTPPYSSLSSGISSDGRYVSYEDWVAGNLGVYDVISDVNWLVTKNTDPTYKTAEGWNEQSVISPDGTQIAYSWLVKDTESYELRLIDLDGSNMRVLHDGAGIFWNWPYAWSPDGKEVLAYFVSVEKSPAQGNTGKLFRKGHLALVGVADGSVRMLKTWTGRPPVTAFLSPDGRYVAYDLQQEGDQDNRDIFLLDLDTDGEIALIEHPANDLLFGWAAHGARVLFRSDRTSRYGLWVIDVDQGAAQGPPSLLKSSFDGQAIGFTADGSYYYCVDTTANNVLMGTLDSTGTHFKSEPILASSRHVGLAMTADFSPDGTLLAYRACTPELRAKRYDRGNWILIINSLQAGDERIIVPAPAFRPKTHMWGPRWSPDGQSLLVIGSSEETGYGMHTVDVQTGAAKLVRPSQGRLHEALWSADGRSIFFSAKEYGTQVSLRKLDTVTRQETELFSKPGGPATLAISPDGLRLAFWRDGPSLVVMPSAGGELREVLTPVPEAPRRQYVVRLMWRPDGEHLIYGDHRQLWKVHVETGRRQRLGPPVENLIDAAIHPDGRQIAFSVEEAGSELWVMGGFLPE